MFLFSMLTASDKQSIRVDADSVGRTFEGVGALSAGASSRLLLDYKDPHRSQIMDYLFKPKFGAGFQHVKVEIGGDVNSTDGTEPSHAHTREELDYPSPDFFQRGYEWILMKEAKLRNPSIKLDCLEWGVPGWIGNGEFFSRDNANYVASFIKGAQIHHDLRIDFTGIWNERLYDIAYIKLLRKTLDDHGFTSVKIVAADEYEEHLMWKIAEDMAHDKELLDAVDVIGAHYPERILDYKSTDIARQLGKRLWNSEGGPWRGDWEGFAYLAKMFNRNYIEGRMTKQIIWSLITAYYDNLSLPNSGVMMAKWPWCGHWQLQPALWAVAHTTQFADPGWSYIDSGCLYLDKGGSMVTLKSPDASGHYSLIIETIDAKESQDVEIRLPGEFLKKEIHVWRSVFKKEEFVQLENSHPVNNTLRLHLEPHALYSLTTTTGQQKGFYDPPALKPFPFPYATDFEQDPLGQLPPYFSDQGGVFEVSQRADGKGKCLKQIVTQPGIEWQSDKSFVETVLGDTSWTDYTVMTDFYFNVDSGYVALLGRVGELFRSHEAPQAYWLKLYTSGQWQLLAGNTVLESGQAYITVQEWHNLRLSFAGDTIKAFINNRLVADIRDSLYTAGLAGLGSGFHFIEFDNFRVEKE